MILAVSATETAAARQCTDGIPIVFAIHGDPVGTGDVKSLARPGGNATGMSQTQGDLVPKLLGLLKETVPGMAINDYVTSLRSPSHTVQRVGSQP